MTALSRAFRQPAAPKSEVPALIRRESWNDPGFITIGPKSYGYRCYPGNLACTRIVRLFTDNGFSGDSYDVSFHTDRPALCTCADFTFRRKNETGETCRHIRAIVALDLHRTDADRVRAIEADAAALARSVADVTTGRKAFERFEAEFA
jgi:hypothetical protein